MRAGDSDVEQNPVSASGTQLVNMMEEFERIYRLTRIELFSGQVKWAHCCSSLMTCSTTCMSQMIRLKWKSLRSYLPVKMRSACCSVTKGSSLGLGLKSNKFLLC